MVSTPSSRTDTGLLDSHESARSVDVFAQHHHHCNVPMDQQAPSRASLDRQTRLAHLKLVTKYYGASNYSYPRPECSRPQISYRRAGQSYPDRYEQENSNPVWFEQPAPIRRHQSPNRKRANPRPSRTSAGSDDSTPSLIDDYTDSEHSQNDDDLHYHASTSELWDSFWIAREYLDPEPQLATEEKQLKRDRRATRKPLEEVPNPSYPALIPSPHIRRTKKASCVSHEDEPLPTRPVEYSIPVRRSYESESPKRDRPLSASRPNGDETYGTIRPVKSSYTLFPRHQVTHTIKNSTPVLAAPPRPFAPPRTTSLPRVERSVSPQPTQRKPSRPLPIHYKSLPVPQISAPPAPCDEPVPRPHTSHDTSRPRPSFTAFEFHDSSCVIPPAHICDPADVMTTLPMFPSTNIADLSHPRLAPLPPDQQLLQPLTLLAATAASSRRRFGPHSRAATPLHSPSEVNPKSFFDFDSDSESEEDEPKAGGGGIGRIMMGRRHKRSYSGSRPSSSALGGPSRKSHEEPAEVNMPDVRESRKSDGKKSDVFGRMFGRGRRSSD